MEAALRQQSLAGPRTVLAPAPLARVSSVRGSGQAVSGRSRATSVTVRAEAKEFYSYKDMPPLPLTVTKIHLPQIGYTVFDESTRESRLASLAIFYDIYKDDQYRSVLSRKSAMTALCMYDRDDVEAAQRTPGEYPNVDLLLKVYQQGLEYKIQVEEFMPQ